METERTEQCVFKSGVNAKRCDSVALHHTQITCNTKFKLSPSPSRSPPVSPSPATGLVLKWTPRLKLPAHLRISRGLCSHVILMGL